MPLPRFEKLDPPRKKSILGAAAEEFGERGFEGASYNRIIERAGISKGAMYYYFADKDDLYRTVLDAALTLWLTHVGFQTFEADDAESFWRACREMYERSLRFMLADPSNAALCLSVTRARERLEGHAALSSLNERMVEWTRELVRKGQEVGAIRGDLPNELLVQMGLAMMDGGDRWLARRWNEIGEGDVEATAKTLVDLFRRVGEPEGT